MNFKKNFSRQDSINKLYEIKPHIQSETVGRAYDDIIRFNFFKNNNFYEKITIDENLDNMKEMSLSKINTYIDYFANFGQCNNSIIVSGSLDYLRIVLINENLNLEMKRDLLELFSSYILDVGFIHDICGGNPEVFKYLNLDYLENHFDRIQDYVSQELGIFPRLDDDEFDEIMGVI